MKNKIREDLIMNKLAKRISAVVLAGAMTLSSSVAAFAADLTVYIRESKSVTTADGTTTASITDWPLTEAPAFVVKNVTADEKLSAALQSGIVNESDRLITEWANNENKYLSNLTLLDSAGDEIYEGLEHGTYKDLVSDGKGGYSHGTWDGYAWMWAKADSRYTVSYPNKRLDEVTCGEADYAIVLSYENSVYSW